MNASIKIPLFGVQLIAGLQLTWSSKETYRMALEPLEPPLQANIVKFRDTHVIRLVDWYSFKFLIHAAIRF